MEWVNPIARGAILINNDEMPRQSDACDRTIKAACDFDVDDGKGNRDAEPPRQDGVQATIPRVIVIVFITPEMEAFKKQAVGCEDKIERAGAPGSSAPTWPAKLSRRESEASISRPGNSTLAKSRAARSSVVADRSFFRASLSRCTRLAYHWKSPW